ncbi:MAG: proprotein convertase P-domain-containing protein [Anaerolineae bacterium]|nr:proprotein convertase P-domain-containing protein [Anaerolineae bacterium]
MKSTWKVVSSLLILSLVVLAVAWTMSQGSIGTTGAGTAAARVAGRAPARLGSSNNLPYTVTASGPYTPTLSVAVRDLPDEPDLPTLDREPVQRDGRGFVGPSIQMPPHGNKLAELQQNAPAPVPDAFGTPILNFAGVQSSSSPPDDTGDVGPHHYLQGDNGPNGSRVTIYDKTGAVLDQFHMEDLASTAPCNTGYCDPIIQYDELADRWLITEFNYRSGSYGSGEVLCVYISKTPDPTGQWWAYAFPRGSMQDYPKYAVWPDGYYIAANNGGTVIVLERTHMLNGQPANVQTFNIGLLPGFGFQLTMPATLEGAAPPSGSPVYFLRPRDTEIHGGTCPSCDLMEMWSLHVDWTTPANSSLTSLPGIQLTDWDHTLCGTSNDWSCMSQPGTSQKLDPIREPIHYPLQYRNFGTHETLVGCFAEDVDGLDRAAVHWFELRRTPPGSGNWVNYQEGVLGDGVGDIHRSVCSAAMDSAGNIAVGYTRTGANTPYYPSIYYSGRRASDPLGTMPYYDIKIWDATTSKTNNERWGDYSGIGVDPTDGCTFWYTTEYGGSGQTRIATFKFDECGTPDFSLDVSPDVLNVCTPSDAVYTVSMGALNGFSNAVTLTSTGRPAGTTELFVPNPLTPPGSATLTIGDTGAAALGVYNITISGASGSLIHQETVALNLLDGEPLGAVTLSSPADGSTGVATAPALTWNALSGASSYDVQVAADPGFDNVARSASGVTGTSWTPSPDLDPDTVYYWRVTANNPCGPGSYSATWAFRTAVVSCWTYTSSDVPKTIGNNATVYSNLTVADSFSVADVNVTIGQITHTQDDNLDIYIEHPDDAAVELSTDNGGSGDNYVSTVFDDEAADPITGGTAPFTGSYQPEGSLTGFDTKISAGTWQLRITDDAGPDTGTLNSWSLTLCGAPSSASADYSDLDSSYGIAWHTGDGALRLGLDWDADASFALGDDDDSDNDGAVTFPNGFVAGQQSTVRVNVQGTATNGRWLRLWFDWNRDGIFGDWDDGELEYDGAVAAGDTDILVDVPAGPTELVSYRARLYDSATAPEGGVEARDAGSYGGASGGEVEDGQEAPTPTAVALARFEGWPEGLAIHVEWETVTEIDNLGFNLYRAESPDGPYVRLNEELIPSQAPGSPVGAVYVWLDDAVQAGQTYYYMLEDVDVYGQTTMHGPVEVRAGPTLRTRP